MERKSVKKFVTNVENMEERMRIKILHLNSLHENIERV